MEQAPPDDARAATPLEGGRRRPRLRRLVVVLVVLSAALLPAALILWSTITWVDRSGELDDQAGRVALAGAAALKEAGSDVPWRTSVAAARQAMAAEMRAEGVGPDRATVRVTGSNEATMRVQVQVTDDGLGSGLAELITGDDLSEGHATAVLRTCADTPHLGDV